eukprot:1360921-Amorphochlora_amoeboformis.AAC.1
MKYPCPVAGEREHNASHGNRDQPRERGAREDRQRERNFGEGRSVKEKERLRRGFREPDMYGMNLMRPATAPETMVAAAAQKAQLKNNAT